ncbi:unnamed protein product [Blepharisma stoltei]|uniref:Uncharacterized protein n=1 Tax=Blepharisma stoltei TaxID=1481888 RepID=A0AAU9JFM0_9CILI|nr:unnamed protein product [Blepharisma stoltei]
MNKTPSHPSYQVLENEFSTQFGIKESSYQKANIFSKILTHWVYRLLKLGRSRPLQREDIDGIREKESVQYQKVRLKPYLQKYVFERKGDKNGLLKTMYSRFLFDIISLALIGSLASIMDYSGAVFIQLLENFLLDDQPYWVGFLLVGILLVCKFIQATSNSQYRFHSSILGAHIKSSLSPNIYEKTLKIAPTEAKNKKENFAYGQLVNLIQVDLERITTGIPYSLRIVLCPIQWAVGSYLLYNSAKLIGITSGFIGMGLLFFVNMIIARRVSAIQKMLMEKRDKRMKYCTELLPNMKVFKMYNWEKKIAERILQARNLELALLKRNAKFQVTMAFLTWGARNYLAIAIIVTMALTGVQLTPGNVFSSMAVIGILNSSVKSIPDIITNFMNMVVSLRRIQDFLQTREINEYITRSDDFSNSNTAVSMNLASFSWNIPSEDQSGELREAKLILKDITLSLEKRKLYAVVGKVGSGKSSLIQAMIQNMNFIRTSDSSSISINGSISYVSQEPWIQSTTLMKNVLFGLPMDEERYKEVLRVCQLNQDLDIFPARDLTEIGERGINLSGGQKARVALARAAYSDHDIYLLDDPLSAVDSHVSSELFYSCLKDFLREKTIVLVTNNQNFLHYVDRIIVLHEGSVIEEGTYEELIQANGYFYNQYLVSSKLNAVARENVESNEIEEEKPQNKKKEFRIIEEERRETGQISLQVYKTYYSYAGGWVTFAVVLGIMVFWQATRMYSDIFLSEWTNEDEEEQRENVTYNVIVYTTVSSLINVFIFFRLVVNYVNGIKAAQKIFEKMITALVDAPINKFYDVTPTGRILNRLSKDQNNIDAQLIASLNFSIGQFFQIFSIACMVSYVIPYQLIVIPIVLYIAIKIRQFYLSSSRELVRLEFMSRSPIVQHFSETVSGLSIIRAFGYQKKFIEKNAFLSNSNIGVYFMQQACGCWLGITLELVSDVILGVSALVIVGVKGWINPGLAGLALSYGITIPDNIFNFINASSNLENSMVSVERASQLIKTESEASRNRHKDQELLNRGWPYAGKIEFRDFEMKYRDNTYVVIKGISCEIQPREKIGIVGRTGSGKSSLCLALFRIVEPYAGKILIDDIDTAEIGLDLLREKISVIPQEPTLFQGTLRENLDPFRKKTDKEIIEAIKLVKLFSNEEPDSILAKEIKENGTNFSVGEKQLLCIARAILKNSKIMFLDEATASIDYKIDGDIQEIIRKKFTDCTVLTIAHRLHTILDYDRILVMDKGKIAEFGSPQQLIENQGLFYSFLQKSKGKLSEN